MEELQGAAIKHFKEPSAMDQHLADRINSALRLPNSRESAETLDFLFEKKADLDRVTRELEELILEGFEHQHVLRERWLAFEKRLEQITDADS